MTVRISWMSLDSSTSIRSSGSVAVQEKIWVSIHQVRLSTKDWVETWLTFPSPLQQGGDFQTCPYLGIHEKFLVSIHQVRLQRLGRNVAYLSSTSWASMRPDARTKARATDAANFIFLSKNNHNSQITRFGRRS